MPSSGSSSTTWMSVRSVNTEHFALRDMQEDLKRNRGLFK